MAVTVALAAVPAPSYDKTGSGAADEDSASSSRKPAPNAGVLAPRDPLVYALRSSADLLRSAGDWATASMLERRARHELKRRAVIPPEHRAAIRANMASWNDAICEERKEMELETRADEVFRQSLQMASLDVAKAKSKANRRRRH